MEERPTNRHKGLSKASHRDKLVVVVVLAELDQNLTTGRGFVGLAGIDLCRFEYLRLWYCIGQVCLAICRSLCRRTLVTLCHQRSLILTRLRIVCFVSIDYQG